MADVSGVIYAIVVIGLICTLIAFFIGKIRRLI